MTVERVGGAGPRGPDAPDVPRGFTLIEVVAALVVFAAGVLMAVRLAGGLSTQVRNSALRAAVVGTAQERMEELERLPYDSLTVGTTVEAVTIRGREYEVATSVGSYGRRVRSVEVVVRPEGEGGPSHDLLSYVYGPW